ncbi:MAG: hypothetical protein QF486_00250 [Candidatus Woesearchaeota archaeon]|jgi:hypothetical protein|nr:hypothetical protein [Candidatus Woesearchaeota archaeon]MDP7181346.1 hypothetical protein [Candidatus Woesearchaeota archaeon]MDP7198035.1 hypothetical protein [Candidatus Woesearchaeota archaeon]MDP7466869.1 hypothetical protein [Candidatus Woesearchaeota archaeon]MDP7647305.1 hypothetical protein [Candidatus Woesearchaeota archaeon]|tara:strand:+ start:311 stop:619 length:309 start_codon:yes stop_codon:yes gene_type:complete
MNNTIPNAKVLLSDAADKVSLAEMHLSNHVPARNEADVGRLHLAKGLLEQAQSKYALVESRARIKGKQSGPLRKIESLDGRADRDIIRYKSEGPYVPFAGML